MRLFMAFAVALAGFGCAADAPAAATQDPMQDAQAADSADVEVEAVQDAPDALFADSMPAADALSMDTLTGDAPEVASTEASTDASPDVCMAKPSVEACALPKDATWKACGSVPNGCGGSIDCGACTGSCAHPWATAGSPGACMCADGYDATKKCLTLSMKYGRWLTCYDEIQWAHVDNPDCRDLTGTAGAGPWKTWCCP